MSYNEYLTLPVCPPSSLSCADQQVFSYRRPAAFGESAAALGPASSAASPYPTLLPALALFSPPASPASAPLA